MIQVGAPAPKFKAQAVVGTDITEVTFDQLHGGRWLVLFFYPLDFTFVCPTEIVAFSDAAERFGQIETNLAGVSVDSQFTHLAWIKTPRSQGGLGRVNFPLVSDLTKEISRSYGVLLETGIALRGLFVIDRECIVRHITVNDLGVGRSVDETLRVLQALQYVQEHGEVCPANWRPGQEAMVPDPEGSKQWFARQAGPAE